MTPSAEDAYFAANPPPRQLEQLTARARAFIDRHAAGGRRVALVTSGGTTVPLERQTVRFIDNFSAGTRGAASAERFLAAGYAVVFLHRDFSLVPFARLLPPGADLLDLLREAPDGSGRIAVDAAAGPAAAARVRAALRPFAAARRDGALLLLPFVTIGDYLHALRAVARLLRPLGPRALLYLAAAVSDFFVPPERMPEHKIQSTGAADDDYEEFDNFDASPRAPRAKRLVVDLDPVPKFLKSLVDGWAPQGMIVSYKLETDPALLVRKARASLARYQHHLVIGNLLATRKWEVVFVSPGPDRPVRWLRAALPAGAAGAAAAAAGTAEDRPLRPDELPPGDPDVEIEELIIPAVAELHDAHIRAAAAKAGEEA